MEYQKIMENCGRLSEGSAYERNFSNRRNSYGALQTPKGETEENLFEYGQEDDFRYWLQTPRRMKLEKTTRNYH